MWNSFSDIYIHLFLWQIRVGSPRHYRSFYFFRQVSGLAHLTEFLVWMFNVLDNNLALKMYFLRKLWLCQGNTCFIMKKNRKNTSHPQPQTTSKPPFPNKVSIQPQWWQNQKKSCSWLGLKSCVGALCEL